MGAVPKRKISRTRRDRRRAHWAIGKTTLVACEECGERKLPHTLCRNCNTYHRRQVLPKPEAAS